MMEDSPGGQIQPNSSHGILSSCQSPSFSLDSDLSCTELLRVLPGTDNIFQSEKQLDLALSICLSVMVFQ